MRARRSSVVVGHDMRFLIQRYTHKGGPSACEFLDLPQGNISRICVQDIEDGEILER